MMEDERKAFNLRALEQALERGTETAEYLPPGATGPPPAAPFRLTSEELREAGRKYQLAVSKTYYRPRTAEEISASRREFEQRFRRTYGGR